MTVNPRQRFLQAVRDDGRYSLAAYEFLHEGLDQTTHQMFGSESSDEPRHVSGQDLCHGLRTLALDRWGPLAGAVLRGWGIRRTRDFGEMVFFLIDLELMGRQESDRIEDFDNVYDLDEAFNSYCIPLDADEN